MLPGSSIGSVGGAVTINGGDATETGGVVSILSGPSLSTTSGALSIYQ